MYCGVGDSIQACQMMWWVLLHMQHAAPSLRKLREHRTAGSLLVFSVQRATAEKTTDEEVVTTGSTGCLCASQWRELACLAHFWTS